MRAAFTAMLGDTGPVEPEHHAPLQDRRGVVEVHDGAGRADQRLVGALDQLVAALREHLDGHVVGDEVFVDQLAHEVEVGLARGREADLDLLEAHRHERLEHAPLADRVHRVDERLVAVAQVDRAPARRLRELAVGPLAIGQLERHERAVLLERHLLRLCGLGRHGALTFVGDRIQVRKRKKLPARGTGASASAYGALAYMRRRRVAVRNVTKRSSHGRHACNREHRGGRWG